MRYGPGGLLPPPTPCSTPQRLLPSPSTPGRLLNWIFLFPWPQQPDVVRRRESLSHQLARCNPAGYPPAMITGFAHKGLENFFYEGRKRGIQPRHAQRPQTSLIGLTRHSM